MTRKVALATRRFAGSYANICASYESRSASNPSYVSGAPSIPMTAAILRPVSTSAWISCGHRGRQPNRSIQRFGPTTVVART